MTPVEILGIVTGALIALATLITAIAALIKSRPSAVKTIVDSAVRSITLSNILRDKVVEELNTVRFAHEAAIEKSEKTVAELLKEIKAYKEANAIARKEIEALREEIKLLRTAIKQLVEQLEKLRIQPDCSQEVIDLLSD